MPFIKVTNGTNLFYQDNGSGVPVVFVHDWCMNSASWEYVMHDVADNGFRCIAYDQRGCGRSDQPFRGYDYCTLADDLAALIERLDLDKVILVGHSLGCGVITQYLADYGDTHVIKAVYIGTTTPYLAKSANNPDGIDREVLDFAIDFIKRDRPGFIYSLADDFFYLSSEECKVSQHMIDWTVAIPLQASAKAAVEMQRTAVVSDQREELKGISTPVLLIHGNKDIGCPVPLTAGATHKLLINSTLKVYKEQPHGIYISQGKMMAADIIAFINNN